MGRHVLVAIGRTDASESALEYAFEEYPEARISVVHVTVSSGPFRLFGGRDPCDYVIPEAIGESADLLPAPDRFTQAQRQRAERVLARAYEFAQRYDREVDLVVRSGGAAREIVDYADEHGVDRIVVADHPSTAFRPLFRSVPESVAHNTTTPVTTL
ncbi:universal stress protein [Natronolimnohabitans innermongolicus]|uniref:UspA domain-containing protein n=1 Tax=Natronolimnohabitans innermongolicus JCM 12255 TaxID=1227499 RepID=L9XK08_9EURY|nr:universal stress protein [Natronolimnohabitans innermongolicus]ELY61917.1 UspA domain-containing protein [Natronolimnohabitans innermongolicus JCM 12255]